MIYFIRSYNKHIKIGYSKDPLDRMKSLQTGSPAKLHIQATMPGDYQTEIGLHELFRHLRSHGEWFRYTDELKWFIRIVKENPSLVNIKSIYNESQKMRLLDKSKRLGNCHKLTKRIKRSLVR
jgi:hypothetical protein